MTLDVDGSALSPSGGDLYLVLGTFGTTTPGLVVVGDSIPLRIDLWFPYSLGNANVSPPSSSFGLLDGSGKATAGITVPPATAVNLAGLTAHHACLSIDAATGVPFASSAALSLDLVPQWRRSFFGPAPGCLGDALDEQGGSLELAAEGRMGAGRIVVGVQLGAGRSQAAECAVAALDAASASRRDRAVGERVVEGVGQGVAGRGRRPGQDPGLRAPDRASTPEPREPDGSVRRPSEGVLAFRRDEVDRRAKTYS